jgi:hypothetical protein
VSRPMPCPCDGEMPGDPGCSDVVMLLLSEWRCNVFRVREREANELANDQR